METIKCSVSGCAHPADFKVFTWDFDEGHYFKPDRMIPHMCADHVILNETMGGRMRQRNDQFPITKRWDVTGWTIYTLLKSASPRARKLRRFLPKKPTDGFPPAENTLRDAFLDLEIEPEIPCAYEECPLPALFDTGVTEKGVARQHGLGHVCGDHATSVANDRLNADVFFRPIVSGRLFPSGVLEGRVQDRPAPGVEGEGVREVKSLRRGVRRR
jgi:hypothetical protein